MENIKNIWRQLLNNIFAKILFTFTIILSNSSCSDFLDIVPDNVPVIDNAFDDANQAEKYLFTCYSYLPNETDPGASPSMLAGDEFWFKELNGVPTDTWRVIAKGMQNKNNPRANYWDGFEGGKPLFKGIRDCNIFLENVENLDKVEDLPLAKRQRWISEVKFLKAYYHFYLLRMYGPIPITDKNIPVWASPEEVRVKRMPVDQCVEYIVSLLDDALTNLPAEILSTNSELGRITQPICLAVKAQVLLLDASPLFNGNSDYNEFRDNDGVQLFNPTKDETKWQRAADAAKAAIDAAEAVGAELYYFSNQGGFSMSEESMTQMSIRHAICEELNPETIWPLTNSRAGELQRYCIPILEDDWDPGRSEAAMAAPLKIVKQFYTKNGVPITEDKTLDFTNIESIRVGTHEERFNIGEGYQTSRLNFDRENRFYANLGFDGSKWLRYDSKSDDNSFVFQAKFGQLGAGSTMSQGSVTGYYTKKLVNWLSTTKRNGEHMEQYPWPLIRLADLYLMYAEALNEAQGPVADVYKYIDLVRKRAGLKGVVESWENYSLYPAKPSTKEGMQSIIRQERLIELAFEGQRYWDLRRWKTALEVLNAPVTAWDVNQSDIGSYYRIRTIGQQMFIAPRDYLWPLRSEELSVNFKLVQNPGW
ncbi:MAG: RagB/SusD family nutrient uptake outer membrane protein [Dysgonomonas sp.]